MSFLESPRVSPLQRGGGIPQVEDLLARVQELERWRAAQASPLKDFPRDLQARVDDALSRISAKEHQLEAVLGMARTQATTREAVLQEAVALQQRHASELEGAINAMLRGVQDEFEHHKRCQAQMMEVLRGEIRERLAEGQFAEQGREKLQRMVADEVAIIVERQKNFEEQLSCFEDVLQDLKQARPPISSPRSHTADAMRDLTSHLEGLRRHIRDTQDLLLPLHQANDAQLRAVEHRCEGIEKRQLEVFRAVEGALRGEEGKGEAVKEALLRVEELRQRVSILEGLDSLPVLAQGGGGQEFVDNTRQQMLQLAKRVAESERRSKQLQDHQAALVVLQERVADLEDGRTSSAPPTSDADATLRRLKSELKSLQLREAAGVQDLQRRLGELEVRMDVGDIPALETLSKRVKGLEAAAMQTEALANDLRRAEVVASRQGRELEQLVGEVESVREKMRGVQEGLRRVEEDQINQLRSEVHEGAERVQAGLRRLEEEGTKHASDKESEHIRELQEGLRRLEQRSAEEAARKEAQVKELQDALQAAVEKKESELAGELRDGLLQLQDRYQEEVARREGLARDLQVALQEAEAKREAEETGRMEAEIRGLHQALAAAEAEKEASNMELRNGLRRLEERTAEEAEQREAKITELQEALLAAEGRRERELAERLQEGLRQLEQRSSEEAGKKDRQLKDLELVVRGAEERGEAMLHEGLRRLQERSAGELREKEAQVQQLREALASAEKEKESERIHQLKETIGELESAHQKAEAQQREQLNLLRQTLGAKKTQEEEEIAALRESLLLLEQRSAAEASRREAQISELREALAEQRGAGGQADPLALLLAQGERKDDELLRLHRAMATKEAEVEAMRREGAGRGGAGADTGDSPEATKDKEPGEKGKGEGEQETSRGHPEHREHPEHRVAHHDTMPTTQHLDTKETHREPSDAQKTHREPSDTQKTHHEPSDTQKVPVDLQQLAEAVAALSRRPNTRPPVPESPPVVVSHGPLESCGDEWHADDSPAMARMEKQMAAISQSVTMLLEMAATTSEHYATVLELEASRPVSPRDRQTVPPTPSPGQRPSSPQRAATPRELVPTLLSPAASPHAKHAHAHHEQASPPQPPQPPRPAQLSQPLELPRTPQSPQPQSSLPPQPSLTPHVSTRPQLTPPSAHPPEPRYTAPRSPPPPNPPQRSVKSPPPLPPYSPPGPYRPIPDGHTDPSLPVYQERPPPPLTFPEPLQPSPLSEGEGSPRPPAARVSPPRGTVQDSAQKGARGLSPPRPSPVGRDTKEAIPETTPLPATDTSNPRRSNPPTSPPLLPPPTHSASQAPDQSRDRSVTPPRTRKPSTAASPNPGASSPPPPPVKPTTSPPRRRRSRSPPYSPPKPSHSPSPTLPRPDPPPLPRVAQSLPLPIIPTSPPPTQPLLSPMPTAADLLGSLPGRRRTSTTPEPLQRCSDKGRGTAKPDPVISSPRKHQQWKEEQIRRFKANIAKARSSSSADTPDFRDVVKANAGAQLWEHRKELLQVAKERREAEEALGKADEQLLAVQTSFRSLSEKEASLEEQSAPAEAIEALHKERSISPRGRKLKETYHTLRDSIRESKKSVVEHEHALVKECAIMRAKASALRSKEKKLAAEVRRLEGVVALAQRKAADRSPSAPTPA